MEKTNSQKIESLASEPEESRERELKKLSKRAVKIFKEKLDSIPELKESKKFEDREINKEADAIIYQIPAALERYGSKIRSYNLPFEIGIGDPEDRKRLRIYYNIKREIRKKLKTNIEERVSGLIFIEKETGLNLVIDPKWYYGELKELLEKDIKVSNYFQDMLKRYEIKKLWVIEEKENISDILNKLVWDVQSSAYAEKKGMTSSKFLRQRLLGFRDDLSESKEDKEK